MNSGCPNSEWSHNSSNITLGMNWPILAWNEILTLTRNGPDENISTWHVLHIKYEAYWISAKNPILRIPDKYQGLPVTYKGTIVKGNTAYVQMKTAFLHGKGETMKMFNLSGCQKLKWPLTLLLQPSWFQTKQELTVARPNSFLSSHCFSTGYPAWTVNTYPWTRNIPNKYPSGDARLVKLRQQSITLPNMQRYAQHLHCKDLGKTNYWSGW